MPTPAAAGATTMAESDAGGAERIPKIRQDLASILPFLPLALRSSSLIWPSQAVEALKSISQGPDHSHVDSGEVLFAAVTDIRSSLSLSSHRLAPSTGDGFALFFDDLLARDEAGKCFGDVVPAMANLAMRLPSLLETHYQNADSVLGGKSGKVETGLRLLDSQQSGIVLLSQELIGALLACAFFCLFPTTNRGARHLPAINFDRLFASLYDSYEQKQEDKIKCIMHYFERISSCKPVDFVSFERKVLPLENGCGELSYPKSDFWSKSAAPLCNFKVCRSGLLEDYAGEALEVDFANKYLGGGALNKGCVQEEIRFMINPELIAGMLFLPSMADNEAIEIIGPERFSSYTGYASSFRFSGDFLDKKERDPFGRRKTRIVAMDALCSPRRRQYRLDYILREINKAFCGFSDQSKCQHYQKLYQDGGGSGSQAADHGAENLDIKPVSVLSPSEGAPSNSKTPDGFFGHLLDINQHLVPQNGIGVVTGNWGCGAFGGDPELKTIIQWLAASQASRPFISYFTFGLDVLRSLDQASEWILSHGWTVGELWSMLLEYSSQRSDGETSLGFFNWLLPSLSNNDVEM